MGMQHNQRAIPFRKNGKPQTLNLNSVETVNRNVTRKQSKPKQVSSKPVKFLVSASYEPLTGFLYRTYLVHKKSNTSHYVTSKETFGWRD